MQKQARECLPRVGRLVWTFWFRAVSLLEPD